MVKRRSRRTLIKELERKSKENEELRNAYKLQEKELLRKSKENEELRNSLKLQVEEFDADLLEVEMQMLHQSYEYEERIAWYQDQIAAVLERRSARA